jgi:hypothetical protein
MFEDYVAGGLLLASGVLSIQGKRFAPLCLLGSWAYVTGMISSSFWYQLEATLRGIEWEPNNSVVLLVKMLLWSTCVVSLALSFRRAARGCRAAQVGV